MPDPPSALESPGAQTPVEVPPALLARLRAAAEAGSDRNSGILDAKASEAAADASSWEEGLSLACHHIGLNVHPLSLTATEACEAARSRNAIATWVEPHGWVVLSDGRGDKARLIVAEATGRWTDADELARRLGDGPDERRTWLLVEAGLASASSPHGPPMKPFQRLLGIVRAERSDLIAIVLYAVFIGLLSLTIPIAVQQLVNTVAFGGLVQPVVVLALLLFLGLAFAASLSAVQAYLAELVQRRVFVRACVELARRLPRVPVGGFGAHHGPELVNRFFDLVTLQKTGARLLLEGSTVVLQTIAGLLILSLYHPLMLGLSVLLIACMATVVFVFGRGGTGSAIGESSAKYELAEWMEELARHGGAFRSRSGRAWAEARADALASTWVDARRSHYRIAFRQLCAALGLQVLANSLVLGLGGFLVVAGELTLGQLVASELIVAAVVAAFARLGKQLESYYDMLAAVHKLGMLLDLPLERESGRAEDDHAGPAAFEVNGLGYSFHGRAVLSDVSLQLAPGERVAIAGPSASGKTTLLEVACGLRAADRGWVAIDGEDLRDLRLDHLRERVLYVGGPEIVPGSVLDNLRAGRSAATRAEVSDALERVGLLEEVRALPEGLGSELAPDGAPFSRSQLVRLMLARAIVARPRLMALDGALAGLEGEARKIVLEAIFDRDAPWTLLVASREPDVLARCERVVQLPGGAPSSPGGPELSLAAEGSS